MKGAGEVREDFTFLYYLSVGLMGKRAVSFSARALTSSLGCM